jgi:outer membrane protein assembly factor BamA
VVAFSDLDMELRLPLFILDMTRRLILWSAACVWAWTALFATGARAQGEANVTVDEILFEGLSTVDESTARTAIRLAPGLVIGEAELKSIVADDLRRLYRLGHFDRVDVYYEDKGEGRVAVIFAVQERRRVKEVTFEGRQKMARKAVTETVKVSAGERLSAARMNADVAAL